MISFNFYPEIGSASNRQKNIYQLLNKQGYDVKVLTCEPSYPNRSLYNKTEFWDEDIAGEDIIRIKLRSRKYTSNIWRRLLFYLEVSFSFFYKVFRMKKDFDFDIIFLSIPPLFSAVVGLYAKWKFKAKLITDVRDLSEDSLRGTKVFSNRFVLNVAKRIETILINRSDRVIVNSEGFLPTILSKKISEKQVFYIPNSLTDEEFGYRSESKIDSPKVTVIYSGNIGLAQNIEKLIEVMTYFKDSPELFFEIIGYGFKKNETIEKLAKLQLTNVKFTTAMSRRDTLRRIAHADIAFVSLAESEFLETVLPGKEIDYMGMGKPIVADVSGNSNRVIEKANCGIALTERSVSEICITIQKLASDKSLRDRLGDNGHQFALGNFHWEKNIQILYGIVEDINVKV